MICSKCKKNAIEFITSDNTVKYVCFCDKNIEIIKITQLPDDNYTQKRRKIASESIIQLETTLKKKISELRNITSIPKINEKRKEIALIEAEIELIKDISII